MQKMSGIKDYYVTGMNNEGYVVYQNVKWSFCTIKNHHTFNRLHKLFLSVKNFLQTGKKLVIIINEACWFGLEKEIDTDVSNQ